jgi:hypothetical protein
VEYIEVSAKTIDDALTEASIKLGTTSDKLEYEVIDKGSNGFLELAAVMLSSRLKRPRQVLRMRFANSLTVCLRQ